MKKITAGFEILTPISEGGIKELQHIEKIGRVCYKSEDRITEDGESAKKFVGMLIRNGHEAMIEHSSLSVKFTVDRGVSHELVRHRIASFAQESTRYCNYANNKFGGECTYVDIANGMYFDTKMRNMSEEELNAVYNEWTLAMEDAEKHYMRMLELGATPQIARSVLPNSVKTEITITANYREWRNFFKLRVPKTAHPQMREVTIELLKELKTRIPVIFDDIEYENP
jgi:thymidylate synthase (FAD)